MSARFCRKLLLVAALASALPFSCAKKQEVIAQTASGKELTAADIDRDPLALLPAGAVGVLYLDAPKLFNSEFGTKVLNLSQQQMPLPPSAGFEPRRDLSKLYVATYSLQGADVAGIAVGSFDREKIDRAADGVQLTPLGTPLVKSRYANRSLYTSSDVGFTVLTPHTALFGNQTGMRRCLDRIQQGHVQRDLPRWIQKMLEKQNAPLVAGFDLHSQPVPRAAAEQLPFLDGVQTLAAVGNFEPPGVNLAGTLIYADAAAATRGASNIARSQALLQNWGWAMQLLGIPQPVRKLEARAKNNEVNAIIGLDAKAVGALLDQVPQWLRRASAATASSPK